VPGAAAESLSGPVATPGDRCRGPSVALVTTGKAIVARTSPRPPPGTASRAWQAVLMSDGSTPSDQAPSTGGTSGSSTPAPAAPVFEERLLPSFGVWTALAFVALLLGIVALKYGPVGAVVTFVLALAVEAGLMISNTPKIQVGPALFVAGGARIPLSLLGPAEALDAAGMTRATRTELDARAFLCIRGWIKQGVRVQLNDPEDPTPYWLVSSRRPAELVAALEAAHRS
jgi:hypothetical protein